MKRLFVITTGENRELCFKASISALCPHGAQIEGVWVPPRHRGQGYARQGVGRLCELLLERVEQVSLYVNEDNTPALGLYKKSLGFRDGPPFKTIFLNRSGC